MKSYHDRELEVREGLEYNGCLYLIALLGILHLNFSFLEGRAFLCD